MRLHDTANYRLIRRLRPHIPAWVAYVVVRAMRNTPGSNRWNPHSVCSCADMVHRGWLFPEAMQHRGIFMRAGWSKAWPLLVG